MVAAPPKPEKKPWAAYKRDPRRMLLEPGWAGQLDDEELAYVQEKLKADDNLSSWWGFRPGQKSRPAEAIRRVAMDGSPAERTHNVRLARVRAERPKFGPESQLGSTKKNVQPPGWSPGRVGQLPLFCDAQKRARKAKK